MPTIQFSLIPPEKLRFTDTPITWAYPASEEISAWSPVIQPELERALALLDHYKSADITLAPTTAF
jgi:hypothetical protein